MRQAREGALQLRSGSILFHSRELLLLRLLCVCLNLPCLLPPSPFESGVDAEKLGFSPGGTHSRKKEPPTLAISSLGTLLADVSPLRLVFSLSFLTILVSLQITTTTSRSRRLSAGTYTRVVQFPGARTYSFICPQFGGSVVRIFVCAAILFVSPWGSFFWGVSLQKAKTPLSVGDRPPEKSFSLEKYKLLARRKSEQTTICSPRSGVHGNAMPNFSNIPFTALS